MKAYWISLYVKVENQDNLKKYAETVTPIIKSFGGVPLVRGGNHKTFEGDDFVRTVVWEFPSYEKAIECHNSQGIFSWMGYCKRYYRKTYAGNRRI